MQQLINVRINKERTLCLLILANGLFLATILWLCLPQNSIAELLGTYWLWLVAMPLSSVITLFRFEMSAAWRALLVRAPRRRQTRSSNQAIRVFTHRKFRRSASKAA